MDSDQAILLTNALKISPAAFEEAYLDHVVAPMIFDSFWKKNHESLDNIIAANEKMFGHMVGSRKMIWSVRNFWHSPEDVLDQADLGSIGLCIYFLEFPNFKKLKDFRITYPDLSSAFFYYRCKNPLTYKQSSKIRDCYLLNRLDSFYYTHVLSEKEKTCIERLSLIRDWADGASEIKPDSEGL